MLRSVEQQKAANLKLGMAVHAMSADGDCKDRVLRAYKHIVFLDPSVFGSMEKDFVRLLNTMSIAIRAYAAGDDGALAPAICDAISEELYLFVWNLSSFEGEQVDPDSVEI
jgi:hypothetical protein